MRSPPTRLRLQVKGKTSWPGKETRPDLICQVSMCQQSLPSPTVGQIRSANQVVRCVGKIVDIDIYFFCSIPVRSLRGTLHTHASNDKVKEGGTLARHIIGVSSNALVIGKAAQGAPQLGRVVVLSVSWSLRWTGRPRPSWTGLVI